MCVLACFVFARLRFWCWLIDDCCSLFVVCCWLFIVRFSMFVFICLLLCVVLFVVICLLFVVCRSCIDVQLFVERCVLFVVCCMGSFVVVCLFVFRYFVVIVSHGLLFVDVCWLLFVV